MDRYSSDVLDIMWTYELGKSFREYFYKEEQLYYLVTATSGHNLWELIYNDVNVL